MVKRGILLVLLIALAAGAVGCVQRAAGMQDGYYTAEMASFDANGWKEFITIYVSNNRIVTAEYNAKNASGFVKSWDIDYMRLMKTTDGTYPNEYTREYVEALLTKQKPEDVDAVTGATESNEAFKILAAAAMAQARAGDKNVALVETTDAFASVTEG